MRLTQLVYFTKLAELEHYGRAAQELYISQPALSNSIKQLEKELGFDLFKKTGRNITLTEDGKKFNRHIVNALNEINKGVHLKSETTSGERIIRIGAVSSVQKEFLPKLLATYLKHTSYKVLFDVFEERNSYKCVKAIQEGQLDFGLCGFVTKEEDLTWIPVSEQKICLAVNPNHKLASRSSISLKELHDYSIISYRKSSIMYRPLQHLAREYNFNIRCAFEDEISAITQILTTDVDSAAFLVNAVESTIRDQVVFIPIEELRSPFHMMYVVYKKSSLKPQEAWDFIAYFQKNAESLDLTEPLENSYFDEAWYRLTV